MSGVSIYESLGSLNSSAARLQLNSTANRSSLIPLHTSVSPTPANDSDGIPGEPMFSTAIRLILYAIIFILAVGGNALVCYITYRNRRMRTFTYSLITNLAVSDIGSVLCLPYFLVVEAKGSWIFGDVMCRLVSPSIFMFNIVTTNTLVAIACDRFRAVVFPFKFRPSTSETRLVISLTWLIAFFCALPSFGSLTVISFPDMPHLYQCIEIFSADEEKDLYYHKAYSMLLFVVNCLFPVLLTGILYIKIATTLKHVSFLPSSLRPQRANSLNLTPNSSPRNSVHTLTMSAASAKTRNETERKFLKMLMVVFAVFVSCYVPYQILYLVYEYLPELAYKNFLHILGPYIYLVTWLPNALNPICYSSLNSYYARAFKRLVCGSRKYARVVIRRHNSARTTLRNLMSPTVKSNPV